MRKITILFLFLAQTLFSQTMPGKIWSEYLINETTSNFGLTANSFFGSSIANIGDFDHDGIEDFVVGADSYQGTGAVWLILMNSDFTVKSKTLIRAGLPLNQQDYFGASVAGIADFDGDNVTDIAVGAPGDNTGGNNYGAVYLIRLNSNGTVKSYNKITSATAGFTAGDFTENINFGSSLAFLGDFNSDTCSEIAVGAPGKGSFKGAVWILSLKSDGTIQAKNQVNNADITSYANYDGFGSSLAAYSNTVPTNKLLVGAPLQDGFPQKGSGAIYLVTLNQDLTVNEYVKIGRYAYALSGALSDYDQFGSAVCLAGDIDKNGYNDIIVGAYQSDDKNNASGAFFILFMDYNNEILRFQKISNLQGGLIYEKPAQTQFGSALAPMSDMDNNGVPGVVAGMRNFTGNAVNQGGISLLNMHGSVTTDSVNNRQYTSVKAWGTVNPNKYLTWVSFEYRSGSGSWSESTDSYVSGSTDNSVGITLNGLQQGTTYQYRVKASNSLGVTYGVVKTFSTPQSTIYVKQYASGLNDGTSWTNAYTDLQSALSQAALDPLVVNIWVAAGTYKPTSGTDRTKSFAMRNNLAIYGGFAGWESQLGQRNWKYNVTILSGNIGASGDANDNSYNIIKNGNGIDATAILDGFTLSGGNTLGAAFPYTVGGAVLNDGRNGACSPTISNCIFTGNLASLGGAIGNLGDNGNCSMTLINSVFYNNQAAHNSFNSAGGAFFLLGGGQPTVINCSFYNNYSAGSGGAFFVSNNLGAPTVELKNSILWGNTAANGGGQIAAFVCTFNFSDVILEGGLAGIYSINAALNVNGLLSVENPLFFDPANNNLRLQPCSPAINAGSNAVVPPGIVADLDGNARFFNSGTVDLGAYEYQAAKPTSPATGGEIAEAQVICYGISPEAFTSISAPSGYTGTLQYQWQHSSTGSASGFEDISSATSATYAPVALTQTTWYRRMSKISCDTAWPASGISNVLQVTVYESFTAGAIATAGETICYNTNPDQAIGNEAEGSGGDGVIAYSWRSSADGFTTAISGATNSTYTPAGPLTATTSYRRYVKDNTCNTTPAASTGTWTVTVYPQFTAGEIASTGETICYNTSPSQAIGNEAIGNGGDGVITYSWRSSADSYATAINGATNATYTPAGPLTATTSYRRYVKDNTCNTTPAASTGTWTVTVYPQFTAGAIGTTGETICYNTSPSQAIGNEAIGNGGDGVITYSWRSSADSYITAISGATNSTYTPAGPLTATTSYRRYVKDNTCNTTPTVSAGTWTVTVFPQFTSGEIASTGETICYNTSPGQAIGNEAIGNGGDGDITYSWRSSADSYASAISGATNSTYTPAGPMTTTTSYRRYVNDGTCSTTPAVSSGTWTVTVHGSFSAGSISASQSICSNETASQLNGSAPAGGNTPYSYQWQSSDNNINFTDISGATTLQFQPATLTQTTHYRLKQSSSSGCGEAMTDTVTITVEPLPVNGVLTKIPDVDSVCYGADLSATFTSGSGGNGTDVVQYRTYAAGAWSEWLPYDQNHSILTNTIDRAQIIIYRDAEYCEPPVADTISWEVTSPSIGGAVTGGTQVCYGTNSTLLTLSGHNGAVQRWEMSTDNEHWINIDDSTGTTFTAVNLTQDTWYRALIQSGVCDDVHSQETQITVFSDFHISGNVRYENNPKTPLNGIKVVLNKLVSNAWVKVDSAETNSQGFYDFDNLTNATYGLTVKSSHPSGQWQTWGGVTNSDYLLVSQHVAGTNLLPVNPPVVRVSASVKVPHPLINTVDAYAIRQAAKYPVTGWSYFDIPKWVFSGTTTTSRIDTIQLACANVTRDIRGLCAGDVNGSYLPSTGNKTARTGLDLATRGTIPVTDEMTFAVRMDETQGSPQPIGAITLFMNYDPTLMEITNVTMPGNAGPQPWFETNNGVLYIGWISTEPIPVVENQTVMLVHARLVPPAETHGSASLQSPANPIRFTLNETMISELADGNGNVIEEVKLTMPGAGSNGVTGKQQNGNIVCYPNPVRSTLNIELSTSNPQPATCNLELINLHGVPVLSLPSATFSNGWHKVQMDVRDLLPGAYFLRAWVNGELFVEKVIISK